MFKGFKKNEYQNARTKTLQLPLATPECYIVESSEKEYVDLLDLLEKWGIAPYVDCDTISDSYLNVLDGKFQGQIRKVINSQTFLLLLPKAVMYGNRDVQTKIIEWFGLHQ